MSDHLERVEAFLNARSRSRDLMGPVHGPFVLTNDLTSAGPPTARIPLHESDLRALVAELKQARTQQLVALGGVYATGWDDALAAHRPPGWAEREAGWKRFLGEQRGHAVPQPEPCDGDCDCDCQPGQPCLCPERDCYCGPCPVCGPTPQRAVDGAQ